jgi:hypothetical protein
VFEWNSSSVPHEGCGVAFLVTSSVTPSFRITVVIKYIIVRQNSLPTKRFQQILLQ